MVKKYKIEASIMDLQKSDIRSSIITDTSIKEEEILNFITKNTGLKFTRPKLRWWWKEYNEGKWKIHGKYILKLTRERVTPKRGRCKVNPEVVKMFKSFVY